MVKEEDVTAFLEEMKVKFDTKFWEGQPRTELPYFEASAKTGDNVEAAFDRLVVDAFRRRHEVRAEAAGGIPVAVPFPDAVVADNTQQRFGINSDEARRREQEADEQKRAFYECCCPKSWFDKRGAD